MEEALDLSFDRLLMMIMMMMMVMKLEEVRNKEYLHSTSLVGDKYVLQSNMLYLRIVVDWTRCHNQIFAFCCQRMLLIAAIPSTIIDSQYINPSFAAMY